jgi:hypothetical protein
VPKQTNVPKIKLSEDGEDDESGDGDNEHVSEAPNNQPIGIVVTPAPEPLNKPPTDELETPVPRARVLRSQSTPLMRPFSEMTLVTPEVIKPMMPRVIQSRATGE